MIHLYLPSGVDWKSTKSTLAFSLKSLVIIGFMTSLRFAPCLKLHIKHTDKNFSITGLIFIFYIIMNFIFIAHCYK